MARARLIQNLNLHVIFPLVVVWALFTIFFGDGKKCDCIFGFKGDEAHCAFVTGICQLIPTQIVNGSVAYNFLLDRLILQLNGSGLNNSDIASEFGPNGTTSPNQFHLYNNDDEPISYGPLLFLIILLCQAVLMYLQRLCLKADRSVLTAYLSEQLYPVDRPSLTMTEKRLTFMNCKTLFSHHGYIIWQLGLLAVAIVFVQLSVMYLYTGEGISQCFMSWTNSFEPDMARWGRTDSFYQRFPGIVDCRVQDYLSKHTGYEPRTDDPYHFDTLCHIPLNERYEFWFRALYSWTIIVACIMLLDLFIKVLAYTSYAARAAIFSIRFRPSSIVLAGFKNPTFPKNISASEIWFLDDLQHIIPQTDFDQLLVFYLENSI